MSRAIERDNSVPVSRKPNHHVALGAGRQFCTGSNPARLQMLFAGLHDMTGLVGQTGPVVPAESPTVTGFESLSVRLVVS